MKRYPFNRIIGISIFMFAGLKANAQNSATQNVNLSFTNIVEILFTGTGGTSGASVTMPFTSPEHYTDGVESSEYRLRVRSNKNFNVTARTNSANFTYSGTTSPAPVMPVSGKLLLKVSENNTGGNTASGFTNFGTLTSSNQNLVTGGSKGNNQTFSVQYKGVPGFGYPAGDYSVNVVYTVTQQ